MDGLIINIEDIIYHKKALYEINSLQLREITFLLEGKEVNFPLKVLEEFDMTGLNNTDLITSFCDDNWKFVGVKDE